MPPGRPGVVFWDEVEGEAVDVGATRRRLEAWVFGKELVAAVVGAGDNGELVEGAVAAEEDIAGDYETPPLAR